MSRIQRTPAKAAAFLPSTTPSTTPTHHDEPREKKKNRCQHSQRVALPGGASPSSRGLPDTPRRPIASNSQREPRIGSTMRMLATGLRTSHAIGCSQVWEVARV
jgi:hypothetical protein